MRVDIVPHSGTGELARIADTLTIDVRDGTIVGAGLHAAIISMLHGSVGRRSTIRKKPIQAAA